MHVTYMAEHVDGNRTDSGLVGRMTSAFNIARGARSLYYTQIMLLSV